MATTYKRDDPDFKERLAKRADELRFRRVIRPYSPTIAQQFVHLAEDKELADIRLEQIKLNPIIRPKPKKTSNFWPIFTALFVLFSSLIFGLWGFSISVILVLAVNSGSGNNSSGRTIVIQL
jgi:hypothetical protein